MKTIQATPQRGDTCANGAVILDIKKTISDGWIVLCLFPESKYHPYVTWWAYWSETGELRTSMGHYHDMLSQAVVDFDNRL